MFVVQPAPTRRALATTIGVLLAMAAAMPAQCAVPAGLQPVTTPFEGTHIMGSPTPPEFGVSLDPGVAVRFDLHVDAAVEIAAIGVNLRNDGGTFDGIPVPGLVGSRNGTMEVWVVPGGTVTNGALFTGNAYTHLPPVAPIAPWTQLTDPLLHLDNLVFAAPDTPSTGTFTPPLPLAAGDYAVVVVLVPNGVAGPSGAPANPATQRMHPFYTDLGVRPAAVEYADQFVTVRNLGVQHTAFDIAALDATSTPPALPNLRLDYRLTAANFGFSTPYGRGCYDDLYAFYESFAPVGGGAVTHLDLDPVGSAGARNGLDLQFSADSYLVTANTAPGLFVQPGSTPQAITVNAGAPRLSLGGWDDATSGRIPLPFTMPYPSSPAGTDFVDLSSNGICYFETSTSTFGFYNNYPGFLGLHPGIAAAWTDFDLPDLRAQPGAQGRLVVDTDPAGQWVAITWDDVHPWGEPANVGTAQLVLFANGDARIRYRSTGVPFATMPVLVGFTPGHAAIDPGRGPTPRQAPDLSVASAGLGYRSGDGSTPSIVRLVSRPVIGRRLLIDVDNVDPSSGANMTLLSLGSLPGTDLAFVGMPGCQIQVALPVLFTEFTFGPGPYRWNVTAGGSVPSGVLGIELFAQAVQFATAVPPRNPANLLASDALCFHFGAL